MPSPSSTVSFLYALSGESLTIKSHDKTYRFRASDATGPDSRSQLQKVVTAITLRQRCPTPRRGSPQMK